MKCIIPGINIKVFGRAVHSLAKIGDDLYVEPSPSGISFRTVNASRSAFACFHFGSGFFSHYDAGLTAGGQLDAGEDSVKCKVAVKAFLNAFRSLATLEKNVEKCKLIIDGEEAKLGIQFTCRFGVVKTYNLSFIECETLQAVYDKNICSNFIQSQSRALSDAVVNFQTNQEEVTLCVAHEKTIIKNYVDDDPDPTQAVHTVLTMGAGEFDGYKISTECDVTFCLKELRALLTFTEPVNLPVSTYFSSPGSPIIFVCDNNPVFEATFVLATLAKKNDSQIPRSQSADRQASQSVPKSASFPQPSSSCKRNDTSLNKSQSAGPSNISRNSEHISPVNSRILEEKGNTSGACRSMLLGDRNRSMTPSPCTSPAQQQANRSVANGSFCQVRPAPQLDDSLPDLQPNETLLPEEVSNMVPGTPPPTKKAKFYFRRCFESTFDPNCLPGNDRILAEDSDDDT